MTKSVIARQRGAIGQRLCPNPTVADDETNIGQQGWDVAFDYSTTDEFLSRLTERIGEEHISILGLYCHGNFDGSGVVPLGGFAIQGDNGPWLHAGNVPFYREFLAALNRRMERNGIQCKV